MKIIPNKNILFKNRTRLTVIEGEDYLLKDYFPFVKNLIRESVNNFGTSKNIDNLQKNIKQFPKVAYFYKQIFDEYIQKGDNELAIKYATLFYQRLPDEFFAKLNMARIYGLKGEFDKVTALLGENLELSTAFPEKTEYHITEMVNFLVFRIDYFLMVDRLENAIITEHKLAELIDNEPTHVKAKQRILDYKKRRFNLGSTVLNLTDYRTETYPYYQLTAEQIEVIEGFFKRIHQLSKPEINLLVEIQIQMDKNPGNPHFQNLICEYHHQVLSRDGYIESVDALYKTYPDFMISKIRLAELLLNTRELQTKKEFILSTIIKMFNEDLYFKDICPNREVFLRFDEYIHFQHIALRVWLEKGNLVNADKCLKEIQKSYGPEDLINTCKRLLDNYNESLRFNNFN